jgi:cyclin-dependent kinase 7
VMLQPVERYEKQRVLGQGTYGVVYLAIDRCTAQPVALKKVRLADYTAGLSMTAWRELRLLPELGGHPNVIALLDVFSTKSSELYLVYEYCETDLEHLITERNLVLSQGDIKSCLRQLLEGVAACHENWVLHRDLKPSNVLVTTDGVLKLADFGLARVYAEPDLGTEGGRRMTHQVVTRWYRAPELLFGATAYGPAVDIWAVGCIFAELMRRVPFLPGQNDLDQLGKIAATLGAPTPDQWPGVDALPAYLPFKSVQRQPLADLFRAAPPSAIDLLSRMLALNPNERISARDALEHAFFHTGAAESDPRELMVRWRKAQAHRRAAKTERHS